MDQVLRLSCFYFVLFHVNLCGPLAVGDSVSAGQSLGMHSNLPYSDIAVGVATPTGWRLLSFFEVMTDNLFSAYQNRGVQTHDTFIISKQARDMDSLMCS